MAAYVYDDFRIAFTLRPDGIYDVRAVDGEGAETAGTFAVPFSEDELRRTVHNLSRAHTRKAAPRATTRDVGVPGTPDLDAKRLGAALADALFAGPIGPSYDAALQRAERAGRGLRLTLSLADAPALLSVPWEFIYRRPRFLASQRNSPVVRLLESGPLDQPPMIDSAVQVLGVIANPISLTPLDVAAERQRVEQTLARVRALGRVQLDWLEPATPRGLREALRDGSYHILHYVGHSDFTADGDGVLFLEDAAGGAAAVDGTVLANLLSDQTDLRLVVLNSCEGARTTLTDPYAGVATTLIQLGVPAVVAMQFAISDRAAITFGEELFTNLIGRQDAIDAAVAEGRKAVYVEVDEVEWATPVLFVRDPDVELLRFALPPAPLAPPDEEPDGGSSRRRRGRVLAITATTITLAAGAVTAGVLITRDGDGDQSPTGVLAAAGERSFGYAVQLTSAEEMDRLWLTDADLDNPSVAITAPSGDETEPDWDPSAERLAFRRAGGDGGCELCAVVPGGADDDTGAVPLLAPQAGRTQHTPTWQGTGDRGLFYALTNGCEPGPGCAGEIRYVARPGDATSDEAVLRGLNGVVDLDVDPQDAERLLVVADDGAKLRREDDVTSLDQSDGTVAATYTPDGHRIFGIRGDGRTLRIWDRTGRILHEPTIAELVEGYMARGGDAAGLPPQAARALSVSPHVDPPDTGQTNVAVLLDDDNTATPPVIAVAHVDFDGSIGSITSIEAVPFSITSEGQVVAAAQ